jgi:hypothetical protein
MKKKDKFARLKISRQRRYQLRHMAAGLCYRCPRKAVLGHHCLVHAILTRERARKTNGCKKRISARSYQLEKEKKCTTPARKS